MRLALTPEAVRASEEAAVRGGKSLAGLMEAAGMAVASEAGALAPKGRIVVCAGSGNNGGDGWTAARHLKDSGRDVLVLALAEPDSLPQPARAAAGAAVSAGVEWRLPEDAADVVEALGEAALIVDALLGIGAKDAPRARYADVIVAMEDADAPVLAVDVPSGVDAGTGAVPGVAAHATVTITFGSPKTGLLLYPGASVAGRIVVADIGLEQPVESNGALEVWDADDYSWLLPLPAPDDHKGTRGRVLVVGGSPGMTGAACLASMAALRAGAGYVTAAVPQPSLSVVETKLTAPVKLALPWTDGALGTEALDALVEAATRCDAVILGPGLGRAEGTANVVRSVLERLTCPVVLDADGLWAIGTDLGWLRERDAPTVVTPHSGEAGRLLGVAREAVDADRPEAARSIGGGQVICVLKGPRTLICDGRRTVVNMTGGPGLATLGTGDVLAGIVGTLLAQGLAPVEAAALGAHMHGASGDAAAAELTDVCCTAEDVITYLPEAVRRIRGGQPDA